MLMHHHLREVGFGVVSAKESKNADDFVCKRRGGAHLAPEIRRITRDRDHSQTPLEGLDQREPIPCVVHRGVLASTGLKHLLAGGGDESLSRWVLISEHHFPHQRPID